MNHDAAASKPRASCLLAVMALVWLAAVGCSEIRPEPNVEQGGVLESPTHEQDALHRAEQRQQQNRGGGGGGSY
jgi:hypothetical protein